jgi:hypothetical protein
MRLKQTLSSHNVRKIVQNMPQQSLTFHLFGPYKKSDRETPGDAETKDRWAKL